MKSTLLLGGLGLIVAALWFTHTFWGDVSVAFNLKMTVLAVLTLVGSTAVITGISLAALRRTQKIGLALLVAGPAAVLLVGTLHASAQGGVDIGGLLILFYGAVSLLTTTPLSIGFVFIAERQSHP